MDRLSLFLATHASPKFTTISRQSAVHSSTSMMQVMALKFKVIHSVRVSSMMDFRLIPNLECTYHLSEGAQIIFPVDRPDVLQASISDPAALV